LLNRVLRLPAIAGSAARKRETTTEKYLGGALWTHLGLGDTWFFPIIIGVLMWLGLARRRPALLRLLLGQELPAAG
jgi:hypothetical protein